MEAGDKLLLSSPLEEFSSSREVTFMTKISTADYDVLPKFKVFLENEATIDPDPILVIEKSWR